MKTLRRLLLTALLVLTAGSAFAVRTVVFMYKVTVTGQDIFIKGGHDAGLVPAPFSSMSIPITYLNTLNTTTAAIKANDASLDWGTESALDWTTDAWPAAWGTEPTYAANGYGTDPENTMGLHWWKFDVDMQGSAGDYFEFKAFMREGSAESWETDIAQSGTPYSTINHWGKMGYITKVRFAENWVEYVALSTPVNHAPVAALSANPTTADTGVSITFNAGSSTDPDGDALQYRFDWDNNGTYDTSYSTSSSATHSYTSTGNKTIKVQVTDGSLTDTATVSVTITEPAQQIITIHYRNESAWAIPNMHWGFGYYTAVSDLPASGSDSFGAEFTINWTSTSTFLTTCFNNGGASWDGSDRTINKPSSFPAEVWVLNNDSTIYLSNPLDAVAPTVSLTAPANGATLSGTVTVSATASDNVAVTKVEFYYDGILIQADSSAPYAVSWNTANTPDGSKTLTAKAFDAAGNNTTSSTRTVTTDNPNQAPVANAGSDITVIQGGTASFNGSASYDPNGSIVSYQWSNGLSGATPTKVYSTLGDYNVTLTVTDNEGAKDTDVVTVHVVEQGVANDFREETVYFIMTDRFADGNPNNNEIWGGEYTSDIYNIWDTSKSGVLSYYHGGDFQGIIDNLDYIQDLGFTAIWITPAVKQPEGRHIYDPNDPITGGGGDWYEASPFHGYWGYDFDQIDPHLHNSGKDSDGWADFDALADALHARNMKLMLDIVVNHGHPTATSQQSSTFDIRNTVIMDNQTWTWETGDPYWNAAQDPHTDGFFSYANGTWLIDLIDFNENGNNNAVPHLKNVYKKFIDHGVDAFRIDTVAYMTAGFWEDFTEEMKAYAASKGNPHFYMCGEAWTGDRTAAVGLIYNGGQNTAFNMLDLHGSSMDFPGWMGNAFKGERGFDDENGWLRISGQYGDGSGLYDPTYLATFVDNHDVTRANGILSMTQYMNNLNFIYLFRGIPVVFYGTEIMYSSWPNYITTTDKNDVVARWMLGSEGINYVKNNQPTLARHLKMLNSLRKSSVAIKTGQQSDLYVLGDGIVSKRDAGANVAYVALSKGGGFSYTITGMPNGTYRLITPDTANSSYNVQIVNISSGSYTVNVPDNSFVVLDK